MSSASVIPVTDSFLGVDLSTNADGFYYGSAISTVLCGITIVQAWIYMNVNHDKWLLKCFVGLLVILDLATTCINTQVVHHYFISNFGNLSVFLAISGPLNIEHLLTVLVGFCVELFFAYRVHLFRSCHKAIPVMIVLSAVGGTAAGLVSVADQFQDNSLNILNQKKQKFAFGFYLCLSTLSDTLTTISLLWGFERSKTGTKKIDTLLQKLFQYTVTRGMFVSVVTTLDAILILTKPETLWWIPFHLSLSKVYVITMLAMLNSRRTLQAISSNGLITDSDMFGVGHNDIYYVSYDNSDNLKGRILNFIRRKR